jgi:exodeoxyribonuclease VIII
MNVHEFNSNFEPCIIENLNPAQYHMVNALSNSRMEDFRVSPANYKWHLENPREDTESLTFGSLVHCAVLEPKELDKRYVSRPQVDGRDLDMRTKEGKAFKEQVEAMGQTVVKGYELDAARKAASQLYALEEDNLGNVLKASKMELSIFWQESKTNCKCRIDAYCKEAATMIDLKTCRGAKLDTFERDAWNYGYHRKADWYRRGLAAHGLPLRHVIFIAIEKTGPRDFIPYRLQNDILELGKIQNNKIFNKFRECRDLDVWPGYSKKIQSLSAPTWAIAKLEEDELA